jgi:hypothetical protein
MVVVRGALGLDYILLKFGKNQQSQKSENSRLTTTTIGDIMLKETLYIIGIIVTVQFAIQLAEPVYDFYQECRLQLNNLRVVDYSQDKELLIYASKNKRPMTFQSGDGKYYIFSSEGFSQDD